MNPLQHDPPWKKLILFGALGALIYFMAQVLPSAMDTFSAGSNDRVIEKSEAQAQAVAFITEQYGVQPTSTHVVHQSDKILNGYLSKEKLLDTYDKQYNQRFPADTFQVEVRTPRQDNPARTTLYYVYVHMESGQIVAWNKFSRDFQTDEDKAAIGANYEQAVETAKEFATQQGFRPQELRAHPGIDSNGLLTFDVIGSKISEAQLQLRIRTAQTANNEILALTYKPQFVVPDSYTDYVERQDRLASFMSFGGYLLFTAILFILAIIYAALYRQYSSFIRGLFITGVFLAFYLVNNFNMADGIRAGFGETQDAGSFVAAGMIITILITLLMAASVYFSLVGGDALWRQMGFKLWPRFREQGYGVHVWRSMKLSYLLAFMLMGVQTVIFIVLQNGIGMWTTSDVTQSPYNLGMLWLFPMLAWCAAISEEAIYRLFGIGLLYKWFKNKFFASLIPTVIWAMGHVSYPIYPSTTRLIELTIVGLLFSYIFIKFGFITAVFTHAIFNSVMMAIMLFFYGSAVNIIAGIVYIVLPVIIAWIIKFWHEKRGPKPQVTVPPSMQQ
ncbi:CPBP family intramembrane glutamic endopeptidase [Paenibacillus abyssi]|uniref:CAAX prenyl protease 2/Lysostaphin resistance protein A-like domain-containing protein n=1 Tax=Paenibacillus abyssi TaxID=1340531 RepID=A0A917FR23_9BACL|nr:CPBP family intramembrane glutamic endopeptidase [Paenibacillus abyssi]GGF96955.1 hypothetical protein GCM10010916_12790 [Paenibacillus abyssi]